jgi:hypothetical protein
MFFGSLGKVEGFDTFEGVAKNSRILHSAICPRATAEETWHQHRDVSAILLVARTELREQIPFL